VFNLVTGFGPVVGEALATHADVDMVSFTGSTRAGRRVSELGAQAVRAAVRRAGLDADDKRFEPHLTLGRVRAEGARLAEPLRASLSLPVSWSWQPVPHPRVGLVRSHLSPGGSLYETLHEWRLQ
jgi:2'-5' RNA ligase